MSLFLFIVILVALIVVHELGHFSVAKWFKIRVDEFGLGFPPKLGGIRRGETEYTVNAIPFGGFVRIYGEDGDAGEGDSRSFARKNRGIQAAVIAAGVIMNVLFAWVLLSAGYMHGLPATADHQGFGEVRNVETTIVQVLAGSPAEEAGIVPGSHVYEVRSETGAFMERDGLADDVRHFIAQHSGEVLTLELAEGERIYEVTLQPEAGLVEDRRILGIVLEDAGTLQLPVHLALLEGAVLTYHLTIDTAIGLYDFFSGIVVGQADFSSVAGPVGIVGVVGDASRLGLAALITLTAVISINLAIINLIPFPALDGGRLLVVALEAISRRTFPKRFLGTYNLVGFALLILLMVVVTYHDIAKLF